MVSVMRIDIEQWTDSKHWPRRYGDMVVAAALFLLTSPLMIMVALAIKCDSRGPIFLRVERIDPRGRRFTVLKFRSTIDASPLSHDAGRSVTSIGALIRFFRIDNLPQLINVFRGEMTCISRCTGQLFFLE